MPDTTKGSLQARRVPGSKASFDPVVPPPPAPSHQPPGPRILHSLGVHQTPRPGLWGRRGALSAPSHWAASQKPLSQLLTAGRAWSVGRAQMRVAGARIVHTVNGEKPGAEPTAGFLRRWPGSQGRDSCRFSSKRETSSGGGVQSQRGLGACGSEPPGGHCPAPASATACGGHGTSMGLPSRCSRPHSKDSLRGPQTRGHHCAQCPGPSLSVPSSPRN